MPYFSGFRPLDFETTDGTTWRSREEFGGEVITCIGSEFQSWAVYRWQGIQIGPRDDGQPEPEAAKLFVYTDNKDGGGLAYGLYIECSGNTPNPHWRNLVVGLSEGERMRVSLSKVIAQHDLTFGNYAGETDHDPQWRFQSRSGRLFRVEGSAPSEARLDDLIAEIVRLPKGKYVDLYIYARMQKADAIAANGSVVEPVAKLLVSLVPLYCQILYG